MGSQDSGALSPSWLPPLQPSREQLLAKPMGRANKKGMNPYIFQSMNTAKMRSKTGHANTMQSLGMLSELQEYITTVEAVATAHAGRSTDEKQDGKAMGHGDHAMLDFQHSELADLPPRTRAVYEENKVLREKLKKYKTRNYELENDRNKKQNKVLVLEEEIMQLRQQLEACSRTPEEVETEEALKTQLQHRDSKIEALVNENQVLSHKIAVDGRMHRQAAKSCAQEKNTLKRQLEMAHEAMAEKDREFRAALLQIKRLQKKLLTGKKTTSQPVESQVAGHEPPAEPTPKPAPEPGPPVTKAPSQARKAERLLGLDVASSKLQTVFWVAKGRQDREHQKAKHFDEQRTLQLQRERDEQQEQEKKRQNEEAALKVKREQAMALAEAARQQALAAQQAGPEPAEEEAPEAVEELPEAAEAEAAQEPAVEEAPEALEELPAEQAGPATELPAIAPKPPPEAKNEGFQHLSAPRSVPYARTAARAASRRERVLEKHSSSMSGSKPSRSSKTCTPPAPIPEADSEPTVEENPSAQQEVEHRAIESDQGGEQQYDAEGNAIQQQYDAEGSPIQQQYEQQYDAGGNPIQQQYNAGGNPIQQQFDAEGNPVHCAVGSADVMVADVTHPEGAEAFGDGQEQDAVEWQVHDSAAAGPA